MSIGHIVLVSVLMIMGFAVLGLALGLSGWSLQLMIVVALAAGAITLLSEVWSKAGESRKPRR